ncbi:helix-turn-helix domain-containing protein [Tessaracoccus rhinocerotis]|nr:helix-turn-helix domain-containing protein [Tessaracoccus rhinocerotis]
MSLSPGLKKSDRRHPTMAFSQPPSIGPSLVRHRVRPELTGLVAGIVGHREQASQPVTRRQVAGSLMPLVLSSGPTLDVVHLSHGAGEGRHDSFVAGLMPGWATTSFSQVQLSVQIYLTPLGILRLLGLPGRELASSVVSLAEAAPAFNQDFLEQLWDRPTWGKRFELVDRKLLSLLSGGLSPDPSVAWMWRQIQGAGGRARIGDLIEQTGWSERHATSRFTAQIGLGPKAASRIVRFENALRALRKLPAARVAAEFGFADQSHLVREVHRFAGVAPTDLLREDPPTAHSAIGSGSERLPPGQDQSPVRPRRDLSPQG